MLGFGGKEAVFLLVVKVSGFLGSGILGLGEFRGFGVCNWGGRCLRVCRLGCLLIWRG